MKSTICILAVLSAVVLLAVAGESRAQSAPTAVTPPPASSAAQKPLSPQATEAELRAVTMTMKELKQLIEEQAREIRAQRAALQEQQERMARLERQLAERNSAEATGPRMVQDLAVLEGRLDAAAGSQMELSERVAKLQTDVADAKKVSDAKFRQIGNFTFSGDFRARYEPFVGGTLSSARNRERFRLRFNVTSKFNDEFSGGLSIASGDSNDPISTNQTFTNFYQRKFFAIDKAFVRYTPRWFKPLNVTAGKFAYTWYRTELTLDNDLNPEGISESLGWDFKNPVFKRFAVVAFHLPFFESSSRDDSVMHGAQVQTVWQFGDRYRFSAYTGFYNWHRPDPIRAAQVSGALGGSSNTNAATASQFASNFAILDLTGRLDVKTWSTR